MWFSPLVFPFLSDFAVGAPLDADGKVFIYHGSNLGFVTKPAQVSPGLSPIGWWQFEVHYIFAVHLSLLSWLWMHPLCIISVAIMFHCVHHHFPALYLHSLQILTGESVGIKMFGYSFSGGLDIDGNLYPDLLVGSLSNTVVLYRWAHQRVEYGMKKAITETYWFLQSLLAVYANAPFCFKS